MQTRNAWLPAIINDKLDVSHLLIGNAVGPLAGTMAEDYWIDLRDLMNYGDQFINWSPESGDAPFASLPAADGSRRYASPANAMAYFLDKTEGRFLEDGVLSLMIKGRQQPRYDNLVLGRA